jgi:hypothetical protein
LSRFASSGRREIAALREAAKRAQQWLDEADRTLAARHKWLEEQLIQTRALIRQVQQSTDEQVARVRAQHGQLQARVREIGDGHAARAQELAATLRKELRAARRRWIVNGDLVELEQAAEEATTGYASGTETASRNANDALRNAARAFETTLTTSARPRTQPKVEPLVSDERIERQASGRLRGLRRLLWRRWYLPGLEGLLTNAIDRDLASQSQWFQETSQKAETAAAATRDSKLAEIESRGAAELERIRTERNFADNEAEFETLGRNLPIVRARRQSATDINSQARALIG